MTGRTFFFRESQIGAILCIANIHYLFRGAGSGGASGAMPSPHHFEDIKKRTEVEIDNLIVVMAPQIFGLPAASVLTSYLGPKKQDNLSKNQDIQRKPLYFVNTMSDRATI